MIRPPFRTSTSPERPRFLKRISDETLPIQLGITVPRLRSSSERMGKPSFPMSSVFRGTPEKHGSLATQLRFQP